MQEVSRNVKRKAGSLTLAKFQRIQVGMSFSSVKSILGSPSKQLLSFEYPGNKEESYQWDTADERGMIGIGFVNDKVTTKIQVGLK